MNHMITEVLFTLMRGLMFPILIKGIISIMSALCRGNYCSTGLQVHTIKFHIDRF